MFVSEGQAVTAGTKLLKLDDEALKLKEDEVAEAVKAAEHEVEAAKLEKSLYQQYVG